MFVGIILLRVIAGEPQQVAQKLADSITEEGCLAGVEKVPGAIRDLPPWALRDNVHACGIRRPRILTANYTGKIIADPERPGPTERG